MNCPVCFSITAKTLINVIYAAFLSDGDNVSQ